MPLQKRILRRQHLKEARAFLAPRFSPTWIPGPEETEEDPGPLPPSTTPAQPPATTPIVPRPRPTTAPSPAPTPAVPAKPVTTSSPVPQPPRSSPPPVQVTTTSAPPPVVVPTSTAAAAVPPPVVIATTPTAPAVVVTTAAPVFNSIPAASFGSATLSDSSATTSASVSPSDGGMSMGGIVGVAAAGLAGVGVIAFVVLFFLRRHRRKAEEEYRPDAFRSQSVALPDDFTLPGAGWSRNKASPRPPTMIERRLNNSSPASYGGYPQQQPQVGYGAQTPAYYGTYGSSPSFSPGQVINSNGANPDTPNSAMHFLDATSPHHSDDMQHNGDYQDLSRSSVTPFQAQQYAEISQRLNVPPPVPQISVHESDRYGENMDEVSHFNDEHQRAPSTPPVLPEPRAFSPMPVPPHLRGGSGLYNFPVSATSSTFAVSSRMALDDTATVSSTPVKFEFNHQGEITRQAQGQSPAQQPSGLKRNTVYDEADAYGGF